MARTRQERERESAVGDVEDEGGDGEEAIEAMRRTRLRGGLRSSEIPLSAFFRVRRLKF